MTEIVFSSWNRRSILMIATATVAGWLLLSAGFFLLGLGEGLLFLVNVVIGGYAAVLLVAQTPIARGPRERGEPSLSAISLVAVIVLGLAPAGQYLLHSSGITSGGRGTVLSISAYAVACVFFYYSISEDSPPAHGPSPLFPVSALSNYILLGSRHGFSYLDAIPGEVVNWNFILKLSPVAMFFVFACVRAFVALGKRHEEFFFTLQIRNIGQIYLLPLYAVRFSYNIAKKFVEEVIVAARNMVSISTVAGACAIGLFMTLALVLEIRAISTTGIPLEDAVPAAFLKSSIFLTWLLLAAVMFLGSAAFQFLVSFEEEIVVPLSRANQVVMNLTVSLLITFLMSFGVAIAAWLLNWDFFKYRPFSICFLNAGLLLLAGAALFDRAVGGDLTDPFYRNARRRV
jgi:hypothetical protein